MERPTHCRRKERGASLPALAAGASVLLSACAVPGERPAAAVSSAQQVVPPAYHDREARPADASPADAAVLAQWWSRFGDPLLTRYVERAIVANNDVAAALGRLRSARAAVASARGALLPSVSAGATASRSEDVTGPSGGRTNFDLGVDAAWEIDLFGGLAGNVAAARADFAGSQASLFDVQRSIVAEVGLNYLSLRDAQARLAIAESNLAIQRDNLQIAEWRFQAGIADGLDLEQARTVVAQTEASLPPLRQNIATAIHVLDLLTGTAPGTGAGLLEAAAPVPGAPPPLATGIPAELLERRPDVVASRRALEAAVIRIGVAQADLYPALRLSGGIGTSGFSLGGLFDSVIGNLVGNITAPIFQGGQIRARIEQQRGGADTALANYRATILRALQDVENALVAVRTAREREAALAQAEAAARETLRLAEIRYRGGTIDFQVLLDAQRSLLTAQDSRQGATTARSTAAVQLFKALGGGWPAPGLALEGSAR